MTEREFLEQLHELNHKINFVKEQSFQDARSCLDVRDTLEKLKIKVTFFRVFVVTIITFCVSRRLRKMYCGQARLCVCLCVCVCMPTLLHGPGSNLGEW